MNREAVYAALFAKVAALAPATFTTTSRRLAFVEDLPVEAFPAVYQNQISEQVHVQGLAGPIGWDFDVEWYVYALALDTEAPASPLLNAVLGPLLELVGDGPTNPGTVEVDGVACGVWVNGPIPMWEGILGNRAVARVPIRILVPYT